MKGLALEPISAHVFERPITLRLPFKFGDTTVTEATQCFLRLTARLPSGELAYGWAAQLMVPRWFDKNPALSNQDTVEHLRLSVRHAVKDWSYLSAQSLAAGSEMLTAQVKTSLVGMGGSKLSAGFGPALVQQALFDAICRVTKTHALSALNLDFAGFSDNAPPDLQSKDVMAFVSARKPVHTIVWRHTVSHDSPIRESEPDADSSDGLPVSLESVIQATNCSAFKIKLTGDVQKDLTRLLSLARYLDVVLTDYLVTLDANEQYQPDDLVLLCKAIKVHPGLKLFSSAIAFIEQPFPRAIALARSIPDLPWPLVLDESDDDDDVFARGLDLGYRGITLKSCKGLSRAVYNSVRAVLRNQFHPGSVLISAEDLTCQPGLCIQQDTLFSALLGAKHIERNGHFFGGDMQGAPEAERAAYLKHHNDVYSSQHGQITLDVREGKIHLNSLYCPGFASRVLPVFHSDSAVFQWER